MPILCFSHEDMVHVEDKRIVERVVAFLHGNDRSPESCDMLPPALQEVCQLLLLCWFYVVSSSFAHLLSSSKLASAAAINYGQENIELRTSESDDSAQRAAGHIYGGLRRGLGFALLRLSHASQTLTLSSPEIQFPLLARPLWPPPYPLQE